MKPKSKFCFIARESTPLCRKTAKDLSHSIGMQIKIKFCRSFFTYLMIDRKLSDQHDVNQRGSVTSEEIS
jgi:hypothetical protein